ncbi:MAG: hypothetical protein RJA49_2957 [Actinomycetota bacterium]
MIRRMLPILCASLMIPTFTGLAPADAASGATTRYVVTFGPGAVPDSEASDARSRGEHIDHVFRKAIGGMSVDLTAAQAQAMAADPQVASVRKDGLVLASVDQATPPWGLDRIDQRNRPLDNTYRYPASAGSGVRVYVVDTGVRATHAELRGRVLPGFTAIADGNGTNDCAGHGTHVSGIIAGTTYGVAKAATIVPVRVLDCAGGGFVSDVIAGLDYILSVNNGAPAVVNMSLGGPSDPTLDAAVARVIAAGIPVAVAAGNSFADACQYSPAETPGAVTVGAVTVYPFTGVDMRATYSNIGPCVDLFAPGSDIPSAWNTSDTATAVLSGTSMATPHVAGALALLRSASPALSPAALSQQLVGSATNGVIDDAGTGSPNLLLYAATVAAPQALGVVTTALADGTVGTVYQQTLTATGGTAPYRWALTSGTLPAGLTLSSGGVLSGTPTAALSPILGVTVTDATGATAVKTLLLTVANAPVNTLPVITTTALAGGTVGVAYSGAVVATGGTTPYSWDVIAGALPPGLSLFLDGTIVGTPTLAGSSVFSVRVVDATGRFADATFGMTIAAGGTPPPPPPPAPTVPKAFGKIGPISASTNLSIPVTLSWAASSGAVRYEVCVDKVNNAKCDTTWVSTATARTYSARNLSSKTLYYWEVRAVNAVGSTLANGTSWWRFTTK